MKNTIYILAILSIATIFLAACSSSDDAPSTPAEENSGETTHEPHSDGEGSHDHGEDGHSSHDSGSAVHDDGHSSHDSGSAAHDDGHATHAAVDSYPLVNCPVTGAELGSMGDPIIEIVDGREVRLCCAGCPDKFKANTEEFFGKMDASIIALQGDDYPLEFCLVSGDELGGDHGKTIDVVVANQLFRVCCKSCIKMLKADTAKFSSILREARAGNDVARPEGSESKNEGNHEH